MKILKSIVSLSLLLAISFTIGCESMDDNYKQYLNEYNYSGKIDSLRVYPGFERVVLAWDNPKDQKSKTIKIVYGSDSTVLTYDSMVDSVSIEGLSGGTGYEFIVYTMDAHKNVSVPTSITAFPISQSFVESLTPPSIIVQTIGADQYFSVVGLSNVVMKFGGNIEYTVTGANGFSESGVVDVSDKIGATELNIPVSDLGVPFLPPGDYTFNYRVSVFPIISNLVSIDEVWLSNTATLNVQPVVINLMSLAGTLSEKNNDSPSAESVDKVIDGDQNTKYLTRKPTTWIMWKIDRPFIATKYVLTAANDAADRDPKDWVVEGSNDGSSWTKLDEQSGISFPSRYYKMTFLIPNKTAYTYYRINITANNGASIFQLADWILYYDSAQE